MIFRSLLALVALCIAVPATAADKVASASSPGGVLTVDITINGEGRVGYAVSRLGKPVIGESHVGFLLNDGPQLLRNFRMTGETRRAHDETWEQPWGEWRRVRDHYNELAVGIEEKTKL